MLSTRYQDTLRAGGADVLTAPDKCSASLLFHLLKLETMKQLDLIRMEEVQGGGWLGCAGFALGVIGLAASIAAVPATGGVSLAAYTSIYAGAIGTGISMADCFN